MENFRPVQPTNAVAISPIARTEDLLARAVALLEKIEANTRAAKDTGRGSPQQL